MRREPTQRGAVYTGSMPKPSFERPITSVAALESLVGTPSNLALKKQLTALDRHMVTFISQSPFLLLATVGADDRCDVSPRGDFPGFVRVLDGETILIPERSGNRRVDSMRNIVETGSLGVIFLIPGVSESLRVNGRAQVIQDAEMLAPMAVQGKNPVAAIALDVEECFLQCGKALLRSRIWEPRAEAAALPAFAEMLMDQAKLEDITTAALDETIQRSYSNLY